MNFEYLFYKKKLCFLHSLRGCKNVVVSSVMEWKSLCVLKSTGEQMILKINVKPRDNKDKITYCLRVKFTDSIVSDMNQSINQSI